MEYVIVVLIILLGGSLAMGDAGTSLIEMAGVSISEENNFGLFGNYAVDWFRRLMWMLAQPFPWELLTPSSESLSQWSSKKQSSPHGMHLLSIEVTGNGAQYGCRRYERSPYTRFNSSCFIIEIMNCLSAKISPGTTWNIHKGISLLDWTTFYEEISEELLDYDTLRPYAYKLRKKFPAG